MIKIKFDEVVPFPPRDGLYLRLVFRENNIAQGHILLFNQGEIMDMSNYSKTTPEVVLQGDQLAKDDGSLATYTRIAGINKGAKPATPPASQGGAAPTA